MIEVEDIEYVYDTDLLEALRQCLSNYEGIFESDHIGPIIDELEKRAVTRECGADMDEDLVIIN